MRTLPATIPASSRSKSSIRSGRCGAVGCNPPTSTATRACARRPRPPGLMANFGVDGPVASYVDIDQAELLCLYGHNVAEAQTVLWERMLAAKQKNGGRIIVADPRKTPTVRQGADLHLQLRAGTNVALMNGIIHLLIASGWVNRDFVDAAHGRLRRSSRRSTRAIRPSASPRSAASRSTISRRRPSGSARPRVWSRPSCRASTRVSRRPPRPRWSTRCICSRGRSASPAPVRC